MDKQLAVCVSGGMDSFIAYRQARWVFGDETVAVFINYKQPYIRKELAALHSLIPIAETVMVEAELAVSHLFNVPTVDKQEVFGRNILLAFYGAQLAPLVWLSALETEMNPTAVPDKRPEFFHQLSALFTPVFSSKRPETVVTTPFRHKTKSDIVEAALTNGWCTAAELLTTVSCYSDVHQNCGACSTCFKRWIALVNNGINEKYETSPLLNKYGRGTCELMHEEVTRQRFSGRFSAARIAETQKALAVVDHSLESFAYGRR
jgi:7-cyano-7-deazaguanine synthase in queuosine biosynthesis